MVPLLVRAANRIMEKDEPLPKKLEKLLGEPLGSSNMRIPGAELARLQLNWFTGPERSGEPGCYLHITCCSSVDTVVVSLVRGTAKDAPMSDSFREMGDYKDHQQKNLPLAYAALSAWSQMREGEEDEHPHGLRILADHRTVRVANMIHPLRDPFPSIHMLDLKHLTEIGRKLQEDLDNPGIFFRFFLKIYSLIEALPIVGKSAEQRAREADPNIDTRPAHERNEIGKFGMSKRLNDAVQENYEHRNDNVYRDDSLRTDPTEPGPGPLTSAAASVLRDADPEQVVGPTIGGAAKKVFYKEG